MQLKFRAGVSMGSVGPCEPTNFLVSIKGTHEIEEGKLSLLMNAKVGNPLIEIPNVDPEISLHYLSVVLHRVHKRFQP